MEGGEGNAKRGCGGWMEECGRGAAVEQLTTRGMLSIPAMGGNSESYKALMNLMAFQSPQWGGNSILKMQRLTQRAINPRNGGQ